MAKCHGDNPDADEDAGKKPQTEVNRRAGLRPDERDPDERPGPPGSAGGGVNMSGTPAGGTAAGGLGGTNRGDGSVEGADLEDAAGAGIYDAAGDSDAAREPYAGQAGGAVGGTPAGKRAAGGSIHRGIDPGNDTGADRTIGSRSTPPKRPKGKRSK